jgi:hypothetical protein
MITHIVVGDANWAPTQKQLDEIKERFLNEKVFVNSPAVKVLIASGVPMLDDPDSLFGRVTLMVTAGTADWQPSDEDLKKLHEQFLAAGNDKHGLVVTRHGVSAEFLVHGDFMVHAGKIKFK